MNFIKKHLILLLLALAFGTVRAHASSLPQKQTTTKAGTAFAIQLPATNANPPTTIYARVEVSNVNSIVYGSSADEWHEGDATITVKFYSNSTCTTPYTLTAPLTVSYYWHRETQYDYAEPEVYGEHFTIDASSGYNYVTIGTTMALYAHNYTFDGWNYHWVKVDHYYDVESPDDTSYVEAATVGRNIYIP